MTRLRRTIAARLKEAQNTAAMLTTFNEVDMSAVMALRSEYREAFEKKHAGVRLGFMSFFVKACVAALKEFPAVNAEIDGDDIVYKNFVHMGIAVGGSAGLVVPVIRDVDAMSFAEIERAIADFGRRARDGALKLDELTGGTFSITNGGVYGSLMSTPILNPPQSGILGMHKIQERPMVVAGKIEARPMMYLALSYDHRIVDGREAVSFLVRVKEGVEDPRRLLLGLDDVNGPLPGHPSLRAERSNPHGRAHRPGDCRRRFARVALTPGWLADKPGHDVEAEVVTTCRLLRCHRHRRRPRRLCVRHPRRAARHEGRLRREARHPRRHLPQHRLHPLQGAAAIVRGIPPRDARAEGPRRAGRRREARPRAHAGTQGRGRVAPT